MRIQKTQFLRGIPNFFYCKAKMNHLYNRCCLFGKLTKNIINYDGCCTKNRKQVLLIQVGQGYSSVLREVAERNSKIGLTKCKFWQVTYQVNQLRNLCGFFRNEWVLCKQCWTLLFKRFVSQLARLIHTANYDS